MNGWAKIKNAAKYADVGERTIREWLKKGLAYSKLPSGTIRIRYQAIDEFLQQFEIEGQVDQIKSVVDDICKDLI